MQGLPQSRVPMHRGNFWELSRKLLGTFPGTSGNFSGTRLTSKRIDWASTTWLDSNQKSSSSNSDRNLVCDRVRPYQNTFRIVPSTDAHDHPPLFSESLSPWRLITFQDDFGEMRRYSSPCDRVGCQYVGVCRQCRAKPTSEVVVVSHVMNTVQSDRIFRP